MVYPLIPMTLLQRTYPQNQTIEVSIQEPVRPEVVGRGLQDSTLYRVEVSTEGVRLSLLKKAFDSESVTDDRAREIFERHRAVKERGLPAIPLMFRQEGCNRTLYVTDLTRGGRRDCLSMMDWQSNGTRDGVRCTDYHLFTISNASSVNAGFADLLEQSVEAGVAFHSPDIFFLVLDRRNQEGTIIVGDLGQVNVEEPEGTEQKLLRLGQNWSSMNIFCGEMNKHLNEWYLDRSVLGARVRILEQRYRGLPSR